MKKVFAIVFLSITLLLGSCSSSDSSSNSNSIMKVELVTPTLHLDESNGIVSWEKQEQASYYEYIINGKDIEITCNNQIQIEDKSSISIRAKKDNYSSNWSTPITYFNTDDVYLDYEDKKITIYFYNSSFSPVTINAGEYLVEPNNPTKDNYTFDGWYLDPYYQKKCDFNVPFTESTIIYCKWIADEIIDNTIFWIKTDSNMSSSTFKDYSSYRVIPLKENIESKTFSQIVNVNSLKENEFASFSIMDGIQINSNRNIWNDDGKDFIIDKNGTYRITFSIKSNVTIEKIDEMKNPKEAITLDNKKIPDIQIISNENIATWKKIKNAIGYEVSIDNQTPIIINENKIQLNKRSHITVRTLFSNNIYSKWSEPKANINYIFKENDNRDYAYAYFYSSSEGSKKYQVGSLINEIDHIEIEGFTFEGWYLDFSCTIPVTFPFKIEENTIFYPKYRLIDNMKEKEFFFLFNQNDVKITSFYWEVSNLDLYQYYTNSVYLDSSSTYYIVDINGNIVKHNDVGHAQRISLAKYNGLDYQICVTSFWGANNIIYLFDSFGNMLREKETIYSTQLKPEKAAREQLQIQ